MPLVPGAPGTDYGKPLAESQWVEINGGRVAYELLGPETGTPLVLTPGGRFSKDIPGMRPLAEALAEGGLRVLLWDRPNCGGSDVQFWGPTESHMRAETLAALLKELDLAPAVIAGGSAGSRDSILTTILHPGVASKLIAWNIVGGLFGTVSLAGVYIMANYRTCKMFGIEKVVELPEWQARNEMNPRNRDRILSLGTEGFMNVMTHWLSAYVPKAGFTVPGVPDADFLDITVPTMIIRSGELDDDHPKRTSLEVHCLIRGSKLIEPPWDEDAWNISSRERAQGRGEIFAEWVEAAPAILEFVGEG
jgi:2-hydroxy-6-oxonona-2,4-dienedioate hydrolase